MHRNMSDILSSMSLYRNPSVLKGAARTVSIFGKLDEYRTSPTEEEADTEALRKDWETVGHDIANATQEYGDTK